MSVPESNDLPRIHLQHRFQFNFFVFFCILVGEGSMTVNS